MLIWISCYFIRQKCPCTQQYEYLIPEAKVDIGEQIGFIRAGISLLVKSSLNALPTVGLRAASTIGNPNSNSLVCLANFLLLQYQLINHFHIGSLLLFSFKRIIKLDILIYVVIISCLDEAPVTPLTTSLKIWSFFRVYSTDTLVHLLHHTIQLRYHIRYTTYFSA